MSSHHLGCSRYASSARSVVLKPEAAMVASAFETDPMLMDVEDEDGWIELARKALGRMIVL